MAATSLRVVLRLKKLQKRLSSKAQSWFHSFAQGSKISYLQELLRQQQITNDYLQAIWLRSVPQHPNPLNRYGRKIFSQADEDGLLEEILRRIGLERGVCVEIGAGDGVENNTLALLTKGWRGVWLDALPLAYNSGCNRQLFHHERQFVTKENVVELVSHGLHSLGQSKFEVLSIDVDGNDGYLAESLLCAGFGPEVIIIETNEILPPPIRFAQPYAADYVWQKSRCFGWSLQSIADLLKPYGYFCVACNLQTGVNAFFVRSEHLNSFLDVPSELSDIYVGRAGHPYKYKDHRTSATPDLVEEILRNTSPL